MFDAQKLVADAMAVRVAGAAAQPRSVTLIRPVSCASQKDLGEFDDVVAALNLSLDVVNLFVHIVELLAGRRKDEDEDDS